LAIREISVNGTDISLIANGGSKGLYGIGLSTTKFGGDGGTAYGGDVNYSGGNGGYAYSYMGSRTHAAGGGGAPGSPYGVGGAGGDVGAGGGAGGGGAVGGYKGGDGTGGYYGGGGGTGGVGGGNGLAGVNRLGFPLVSSIDGVNRSIFADNTNWGFESIYNPLRSLSGGGGTGASSGTSYCGPGAGSGARASNVRGSLFGGGGATVYASPIDILPYEPVFFGGGSGGSSCTATGPAKSNRAGNGLVIIELIGVII
jgi:hypothetical protein